MTQPDKTYMRALTIAGSDSGGGAGIQADLKTFSALGCYGMSVITALTAQNTQGVTGIHDVPVEFVKQQLEAVLGDIGADAVKIGMLHSPDTIRCVAEQLQKFQITNIVLDPVMVAKSGDRLIQDEAVQALKEEMVPRATVVTPNRLEAATLAEMEINTPSEREQAGREILALGPQLVLVKGGGDNNDDCLVFRDGAEVNVEWLRQERIVTGNVHGTGCTLSSAIAACLANGYGLRESVRQAKQYLTGALQEGSRYRLGDGKGPVAHFYNLWKP